MSFRKKHQNVDNNDSALELVGIIASQTSNDRSSLPSAKPPSKGSFSRFYVGLKSLGLGVFSGWRRIPEGRKIAVYRDRRTAAIRCIVHLLPISAAITLIVLNFSHQSLATTIGHQVPTALQFTAKLHELTMVASLAVVLLSFTCHYLTRHEGLPFGAAFASLQAVQLSYIYSPELLGALRSKHYGSSFKAYLGATLLLFAVLMATVGPSSATCMIPRYRTWLESIEELYVNASPEDLFPTSLDASNYQRSTNGGIKTISTFGPPSIYEYESLAQGLFNVSEAGYVHGALTAPWKPADILRPLTLSFGAFTVDPGEEYFSASPANTSIQSATLVQIQKEDEGLLIDDAHTYEIEKSMDASATVQCLPDNEARFNSSSAVSPRLNFSSRLTGSDAIGQLTRADAQRLRRLPLARACGNETKQEPSDQCETGFLDLFFVDIPGSKRFGAVYAYSGVHYEADRSTFGNIWLTPCTFDLSWLPSTLQFSWGGTSSHRPSRGSKMNPRVTTPSREWLDLISPTVSANTSAFKYISQIKFVQWDNVDLVEDLFGTQFIISTMLAVALSRTAKSNISNRAFYESFGDVSTPIRMREYKSGYGWGPDTVAIRVSLAILIAYCTIAMGHTIYSLWTGISSTAWDTISEALALALNSPSPTEMKNTSAGIKMAQVFEHRVQVAAVESRGEEGKNAVEGEGTGSMGPNWGTDLALLFPSTDNFVVSNLTVNAPYGSSPAGNPSG